MDPQLDRPLLEADLRRLCQAIGTKMLARLSPGLQFVLKRSRVDLASATWDALSPVLESPDAELVAAIDALGVTMGAWRGANEPLPAEVLDAALEPLWGRLP